MVDVVVAGVGGVDTGASVDGIVLSFCSGIVTQLPLVLSLLDRSRV